MISIIGVLLSIILFYFISFSINLYYIYIMKMKNIFIYLLCDIFFFFFKVLLTHCLSDFGSIECDFGFFVSVNLLFLVSVVFLVSTLAVFFSVFFFGYLVAFFVCSDFLALVEVFVSTPTDFDLF